MVSKIFETLSEMGLFIRVTGESAFERRKR